MKYHISSDKKGSSYVFILMLACLVSIISVFLAYYLTNIKPHKSISPSKLIAADYQIESAVIMLLQKCKSSSESKPQDLEKEIMPGFFMTIKCSQIQKDEYLFDASVKSENEEYYRKIKAKGNSANPDKIEFLE